MVVTDRGASLGDAWRIAVSPPGAWPSPDHIEAAIWHPATVPGTAAAALEEAGLWHRTAPTPLHDQDVWYATKIEGHGACTLRFDGLATIAEVWLDDQILARSTSMFVPLDVPVTLSGLHRLSLCFRSLAADLAGRTAPRARWRTRMVNDPKLRLVRTTLLGHAPGWCPPIHAVGPWRGVHLLRGAAPEIHALRSTVEGRDGRVSIAVALPGTVPDTRVHLSVGSHQAALLEGADGLWHGTVTIPDVALWWPRTHGEPHLYALLLHVGAKVVPLGRTGFRTLTVDRGPDGQDFQIRVNEVPIFCRGVCWTPDLVTLDGRRDAIEPVLQTLADAYVNMIRVGGTMVYEDSDFHALCDELGILVWQDCMLANFDYPRDEAFVASVRQEVEALLHRTAASPSLAIFCGGSEILQQAAMMGLPPAGAAHPLFDTELPALLPERRPDVAYVPASPSGGTLPFVVESGPSHYYGVGAYKRPLEDARRARVRFASECLAFSNVPEDAALAAHGLDPHQAPERWAAGVPHDNGADWTFEDTRHHYMALLHGVDPAALRATDLARYLDLSRATVAEVTERTFDEWRRPGSSTNGGLVWFARDLAPGAGWGVIDIDGRPKANLHAMKRAFAPQRLSISDEGVNGLVVHCVNDGPEPLTGRLRLECLRNGTVCVMKGEEVITVPPRGGLSRSAFALFGTFFDAGDAYRFGPAPHDTVWASFESGEVTLEAWWHLDEARRQRHGEAPEVNLVQAGTDWILALRSPRALVSVVAADHVFVPDDNWFHLAPGRLKRIRLMPPRGHDGTPPNGVLRAVNLAHGIAYGAETCDDGSHRPWSLLET